MKKSLLILSLIYVFYSCSDEGISNKKNVGDTIATTTRDYKPITDDSSGSKTRGLHNSRYGAQYDTLLKLVDRGYHELIASDSLLLETYITANKENGRIIRNTISKNHMAEISLLNKLDLYNLDGLKNDIAYYDPIIKEFGKKGGELEKLSIKLKSIADILKKTTDAAAFLITKGIIKPAGHNEITGS